MKTTVYTPSALETYKPMNLTADITNTGSDFYANKLRSLEQNVQNYVPKKEEQSTPQDLPSDTSVDVLQHTLTGADIRKQLGSQTFSSVSSNAYAMDPSYKQFVDYYKQNGKIRDLPEWAQKNFDQFALHTHYLDSLSQESMTDSDILASRSSLVKPKLKPVKSISDVGGRLGSLARAFTSTIALGANAVTNDIANVYRYFTGKETTNDSDLLAWQRQNLREQGSSISPETALYLASKELKFASAFLPGPIAAPVGALGGLGETAALAAIPENKGKIDARDVAGNVIGGALTPIVAQKGASLMAPSAALGKFIPQSSIIGRIFSTGLQGGGGGVGSAIGETTGESIAGRTTPQQALKKIGEYGIYGTLLGLGFGTAREVLKSAPIAFQNAKINANTTAEIARKEAISVDPASETALRSGVDPKQVRFLQDSNTDDLGGYLEQIAITKGKMAKFGGTENVKRSIGDKVIDAIKTVFKAKEDAGKALGAIREQLSTEKIIPMDLVDGNLMDDFAKVGVEVGQNGELIAKYPILDNKELGKLQLLWDSIPDGNYSPRDLDVMRQNINDLMKGISPTNPSQISPILMGLKSRATSAISEHAPEAYMQNMAKYAEATDILQDASTQLRLQNEHARSISELKASLGDKELRAGEIANRLSSNAAGRTEPFLDRLQAFAKSSGWEWNGNIKNQADFGRLLERISGTQQEGSLEGITKHVATETLRGMSKKAAKQLLPSRESQLNAISDYIKDLVSRQWQGAPELTALSQLGDKLSSPFQSVDDATRVLYDPSASAEATRAAKDFLHANGVGNVDLPALIKKYGSEDAIPMSEYDILEKMRVDKLSGK